MEPFYEGHSIILELLAAVFGSSVLTAAITAYFSRRKTQADAASVLVDSNLKWTERLVSRIDELEKILEIRNKEILDLKLEIVSLKSVVEDLRQSMNPTAT